MKTLVLIGIIIGFGILAFIVGRMLYKEELKRLKTAYEDAKGDKNQN